MFASGAKPTLRFSRASSDVVSGWILANVASGSAKGTESDREHLLL
jgi:hypothetical protein